MGQAIIFKGVTVNNPLQTVTFPVTLETANDYVSRYLTDAPTASAKQTELTTVVQTLITAGIWDKVAHCYPIMGGLTEYYYDLKKVTDQDVYGAWRTPINGTTWDATRNCINLNLPGNALGTPMVFDGLSRTSSCFIASLKNERVNSIASQPLYTGTSDSYLSDLLMKKGGYNSLAWSTDHLDANTTGYSSTINGDYIFAANFNGGATTLKFAQDSATLNAGGTGTTGSETNVTFAFGSSFLAETTAPAANTFQGNFNFFMAFNTFLTDNELAIATQAIYDFNESCGRHIDFV